MPDRDQILQLIDDAYVARIAGDRAALARYWAPEASFRIAANSALIGDVPDGECDAEASVARLIDLFRFHDLQRVSAVVEGNRAAIHWRLRVSAGDGPAVDTEILDLWQLSPEGKLLSLVQFTDTAQMAALLG
ncbi:hypothetical protein HZY97_18260 [Sphingomonas sp. R-74633]|uniref:nuclear transport factor 2 family protein n=1 Tax=Sphingomonas sp. R-74633 TaxID=2751188 RepID=UPI0015D1FAF0|nr:hypothetical protein [Sphingomonas sp. R-74633]NYT42724.1 hypothetical protein [Sphingomonas sp. R-74633]